MKEHPECHAECSWLEQSYNSTSNLQVDNNPVTDRLPGQGTVRMCYLVT